MLIRTIALLCCLYTAPLLAQNVVFEGIKRTKSSYLLQFMGWNAANPPTDSVGIAAGVQRIRNTRFFNEVSGRTVLGPNGDTTVVLKCQEIFTVLPILEFGASEGNRWVRAGMEDENGLGRGIQTIVFYQFNDRHSYYLKQSLPMLHGRWGASYLLKNWSIKEPIRIGQHIVPYNYTNWDAEVMAKYAFDINRNNLEAGIGYLRETYEVPNDHMVEMAENASLSRYLAKANHFFNFQDHNTIYVKGWSSKTQLLMSRWVGGGWFHSILNESKYFKQLPHKGNLAMRLRLGISTNGNAFLAPFVLDNYYNIRGIGNRLERGTATLTFNLEHRQTVFETKNLAIQVVGFTDFGTLRSPNGPLSGLFGKQNTKIFSGLGGRFIYKKAYECDLRIDYGIGLLGGSRGFVIGLGQYF